MANVSPYRALHYNKKFIANMADVITPPYDVIPAGQETKYWNRSPYNFAHVDLAKKKDDDYVESDRLLKKWQELGVVTLDAHPCYYLYEQKFSVDNDTHRRRTLMGTVELVDFSEGIVLPHERTHGKHKKDRLQLMTQTQCQLSHVFGMVKDPQGFLESKFETWMYREPMVRATDENGVEHTMWQIDAKQGEGVKEFFASKPIYIVDGHHRYESSLMYAKEIGAKGDVSHPASSLLFAIANVYDPALVVFPTHRWIRNVSESKLTRDAVEAQYLLTPMEFSELKGFCATPQKEPKFAISFWGGLFLCTPRNWMAEEKTLGKAVSRLAVTWSDNKLLSEFLEIKEEERSQKIQYEKDLNLLWEQKGPQDLLLFHAPPAIESITAVSDERGFMPQKSTYFYPKLGAGLNFRRISR